ncbi:uncharacterized protein VICG_01843 [Vittaforma corneae ATCC 50505]|uniref:Uncharacterized protein n=1 Tax=Vittaforma corneae (strain ATCC 50505) TaxID=993615 RepID=L2GKK4_VITCO|nr:uncharacterized protein VICG_01843 [Vittaforma corneae ATCC 50505]ELA41144.1 hypothetical protein VICG_01843 [Vittaforma corneae ATCC 50505]
MKQYKSIRTQLHTKPYASLETVTHIVFYAIRLTFFVLIRGLTFNIKVATERELIAANDVIISYTFSFFLLFFALCSVITENIYGYYLSAILMFHNSLFTIAMLILISLNIKVTAKFLSVGIVVSISYFVEMCFTLFYIYRKRVENSKILFQKIGADPKINDMFSTRKKLQTLGLLNFFISIITIQKLYLPPVLAHFAFEYATIIILGLTILQHIFIYANFHNEDLTQRKIAMVITVVKAALAILLAIFTIIKYIVGTEEEKVVKLIVYIDLLMISLVFFYYLWTDMNNFGKGLKKQILFKTRELTL